MGLTVHCVAQVNTPMLVSPIMMIPKYQTPQQLQELYLDQVNPKPQIPKP
jgi:hypothetical protein